MEYYAVRKNDEFLCRDLDDVGNHYSQQTDTRTENQTPHVLTHRWVLNKENTWTQGEEDHTPGLLGGWGARGGYRSGGIGEG